jgi:hypothetical protein
MKAAKLITEEIIHLKKMNASAVFAALQRSILKKD